MLFTVKLRFFVHKGLQLQLTPQLCLLGSFWTVFMDLEPVPDYVGTGVRFSFFFIFLFMVTCTRLS